jgi:hypothetical protein
MLTLFSDTPNPFVKIVWCGISFYRKLIRISWLNLNIQRCLSKRSQKSRISRCQQSQHRSKYFVLNKEIKLEMNYSVICNWTSYSSFQSCLSLSLFAHSKQFDPWMKDPTLAPIEGDKLHQLMRHLNSSTHEIVSNWNVGKWKHFLSEQLRIIFKSIVLITFIVIHADRFQDCCRLDCKRYIVIFTIKSQNNIFWKDL